MESLDTKQQNLFGADCESEDHELYSSDYPWWDQFGNYICEFVSQSSKKIRTLSLFSGAGGLDIGFHDAGFEVVEAVEIDPKLAASLKANVGHGKYFGSTTNVVVGDISDYDPRLKNIEFIIGGPPCQTFSAAGARASGVSGTRDKRGSLFQEYVRILQALEPKGFLFENVYRILGANGGKDWEKIREAFSAVGYELAFRILDAADYGVPQNRERLIIVGVRNEVKDEIKFRFPRPTHGPDSACRRQFTSSRQALVGINQPPEKVNLGGRYGHLLSEVPPGLNYSYFTKRMGHPSPIFAWRSKFSDFLYKADPAEPVRTIKANGGQYTGPFHWDGRPFSIEEFKRLQTFPDAYEMSGGKGIVVKQIGNSVPPQFARILALAIREQVFGQKTPFKIETIHEAFALSFRKNKSARTKRYAKIAREAIKNINVRPTRVSEHGDTELKFDLNDSFNVDFSERGSFVCEIKSTGDQLSLSACEKSKPQTECSILIRPMKAWELEFKSVLLNFDTVNWQTFTGAWKVFENFLIKENIKADLEQLSGYYQYPSNITCKFLNADEIDLVYVNSRFLDLVLSGRVTQRKLSIDEIAAEAGLTQADTLLQLKAIKKIGYSVRSINTNEAMEDNTFLIPYSFPTLNPKSVQLNKGL